ncbi:hypothetical protein JOC77_003362 [Peribacillus deserti]|uniref:Sporulation histidine kinase inhibitor Sda n=1 Tax=Peribacillus deserti TaxID=673318 RepID=A0ABS2QL62_9BACI|nr:hypothetical protein [Peribacillus deserti]MBM7693918.1 hypothetical protein [Peribacillus deserti]
MVDEEERLIFLKELGHLIDEYKNCHNEGVQRSICDDILLLCGALVSNPD